MTFHPGDIPSLPPDVLRIVFEQLEDDVTSMCNIGLVCHAWRSLSLSPLFRSVDLSCHHVREWPKPVDDEDDNDDSDSDSDDDASQFYPNGRLSYAEHHASIRPVNLVRRQRAFLRAIITNAKLATHVKSFTWTLLWKYFTDTCLTDIDYQTWIVFSQMRNVTELDLASLHNVHDDNFVRQSPSQLFPAVTDLRLVGWMHRGLVKAVIASIDTAKLHTLVLDYLQDEGAHPGGSSMSKRFVKDHNANGYEWAPEVGDPTVIGQALLDRQESGKAFIFPGPMWLPFNILSTARLDSLTRLRIDTPPLSGFVHLQNYHIFFHKTTDLIRAASASLRSLVIILGDAQYYPDYAGKLCGRRRQRQWRAYMPWRCEMASLYLYQLVTTLNERSFPKLVNVQFEGFDGLETVSATDAGGAHLPRVFEAIRNCPFAATASFTEIPSRDERPIFNGYISKDVPKEWRGDFGGTLQESI